jgi:hypothetical protein
MTAATPINFPVSSVNGVTVNSTEIVEPSLRIAGHGKEITVRITAVTSLHKMVVAIPVPLPQSLRNNEIERLFERLLARITEYPLGTRIPKANDAGSIRGNNCIGTPGE